MMIVTAEQAQEFFDSQMQKMKLAVEEVVAERYKQAAKSRPVEDTEFRQMIRRAVDAWFMSDMPKPKDGGKEDPYR